MAIFSLCYQRIWFQLAYGILPVENARVRVCVCVAFFRCKCSKLICQAESAQRNSTVTADLYYGFLNVEAMRFCLCHTRCSVQCAVRGDWNWKMKMTQDKRHRFWIKKISRSTKTERHTEELKLNPLGSDVQVHFMSKRMRFVFVLLTSLKQKKIVSRREKYLEIDERPNRE